MFVKCMVKVIIVFKRFPSTHCPGLSQIQIQHAVILYTVLNSMEQTMPVQIRLVSAIRGVDSKFFVSF